MKLGLFDFRGAAAREAAADPAVRKFLRDTMPRS